MAIVCGIDAAALGRLIETLYQAAQSPEAWTSVMAHLCKHLCADSALIRFYAPDWSEVLLSATHGFDPSFDAAYREHFVHIDPIPPAIRQLPSGTLAFLEDIVPFARLKHTEFYNDYMRPQDKRHVMGGYLSQERGSKVIFGVQRGRRGRPFESTDQALLRMLTPHFKQVLRLHQMFAEAKAMSNAVQRAIDTLNIAAFFLDRGARVCFTNLCAESLVRESHFLTLRQGYLHALRHDRDVSLQQLIAAVTKDPPVDIPRAGGAIRLAGPGNRSDAVIAVVSPWRCPSALGTALGPRIMAAVLVGNCGRPELREHYLAGAFGLTRSEARLAAKLVETCDLECSAEAIGVTRQTARAYLKAIFRKTDCRNQAHLIAMVLSSPTGLWGRDRQVLTDDAQGSATHRQMTVELRRVR